MVNQRRYQLLWAMIGIGVFIILAGIALAILNRAPATPPTSTPATVQEIPRVPVAEAKTAFDAGKAVFVDVRDNSSYNQSHIPGALNIPLDDLPDRLNELIPSSWIITYCT